ncbi:hypothetical protein GmHk_10G028381 [Glycine max]|nr:hypothetical protein GmHk_10G028381 [Glycine max]
MFHAFHCYTPFQFSIFHFHCAFWIVGFEFSPVSISLSPPFLILILSLFLSFFFLPPFEDGALVLLFSKCRTEMREMLDEKLKAFSDIKLSPRANSVRHLKDSLIESYLTMVNPLFFLCKTKAIDHRESFIFFFTQMNIVRLPMFCLNSTILKNMDLCVAFATYFYLFLCCMFEFLSLSCSFLYYLKKNDVYYYD